ncbi:DUF6098 family protein [Thermopolyspora sp. NPDC052614]|uniref:DUF6098 family protein n=1 Tax=Thermopolyspora sp. NPDC052614 TaxID=3155682 RepID=UPI003429C4D0
MGDDGMTGDLHDEDLPVIDDLDRSETLVRERPGPYPRHSRGPQADEGRPGVDHESGLRLPGLSVTRGGTPSGDPPFALVKGAGEKTARQVGANGRG